MVSISISDAISGTFQFHSDIFEMDEEDVKKKVRNVVWFFFSTKGLSIFLRSLHILYVVEE